MIWGGTRLLGAWVGILAFRQALALAGGIPSLIVVIGVVPSFFSEMDPSGSAAAASSMLEVIASKVLSDLIQFGGLSGLCWYLLKRTDRVADRLSRNRSGSDAA
jgi:hypothetical protein